MSIVQYAPAYDLASQPAMAPRASDGLWPEAIDTPGYVPSHLKRSATAQFPILEIIQRLLYRLKPGGGGDLKKVLALIGLYQAVRPLYTHTKDFILWALTVKVTVPETDPIAKEILAWMGSNVISKSHARSAMLVTGGEHDQNDRWHRRMMNPGGAQSTAVEEEKKETLSLPPLGTQLFWVGFRPFFFSRRGGHSMRNNSVMTGYYTDSDGHIQNALVIMTLGWSLQPLRDFTNLCHDFMVKNLTGTTTVYFAGDGRNDPYGMGASWQSVVKVTRKLDTIDMDEATKSNVIQDAEYYYSEEARSYFADCGIPYRRGYLFHGPPGTGKSSFSAALAGHLGCSVYHINLASGTIDDNGLHRLFTGLPRKCVVVIEDIDSAGIGRETVPARNTAQHAAVPGPDDLSSAFDDLSSAPPVGRRGRLSNSVTLSGLLNAIDGNASQEGRLLIMTSNNPDALDEALTRPGRVDKKVYFGYMGTEAGISIFKRLVGRLARSQDPTITTEQIEHWATEFANQVPTNTFSPAQIQNFLQGCRGDAKLALRNIGAWVTKNRPGSVTSDSGISNEADTVLVNPANTPTTVPILD
ncbi:mitochondrial chaperone bcs1 [Pyrenophora seminiperda CCB06]|uniref:Mitochondrial chaperone bcs1 n=1 Tax=Pyrenophora seminiperda CCB06 TaxID=1302712 RepID=A0A3M7LV09_9PLEO|nr:mitochondrial chaperone bcs1 [Pyrenophora seminiperda CCB06]